MLFVLLLRTVKSGSTWSRSSFVPWFGGILGLVSGLQDVCAIGDAVKSSALQRRVLGKTEDHSEKGRLLVMMTRPSLPGRR